MSLVYSFAYFSYIWPVKKIALMYRVILCVTNDLENDQRVNRSALTLHEAGFDVLVVGRMLPKSSLFQRAYKIFRFRLLFRKSMFFYAEYNIRLFLFLLFKPFSVLIANDLDTLPACWLASRIKKGYLVYDSHELFTEVPELVERPRVQKIWVKMESFLVPRVDKALTVCEPIAEIYFQKYGKEFEVVRNVPIKKVAFGNVVSRETVILYQGAVNKGRGIELMIDAMTFLPDAKLVIAGNGDLLDSLKEKARQSNSAEKITFLGHVAYDRLHTLTSSATVGISLEEDQGLNYRFALPNKIFDYIQSGIPVVVSNLPVMAGLVKEYGIGKVLGEREPELLAQTLNEVISNQRKGYFAEYLQKAANSLHWDNEKQKFLSIFADLNY